MPKKKKTDSKKSRTHKSIWTGDWDKDGIKNIDDKYPFNKKKNKRVNKEISLSKAWVSLKKRRKAYKKDIKHLSKSVKSTKHRVKSMYSTIHKQMTRNIHHVQDKGGLMIIKPNRTLATRKYAELKKKFKGKIIEKDNRYKITQKRIRTKDPYFAYHLNVLYRGRPYEIQIKSKPMARLGSKMHKAYKQKDKKALNRLYIIAMNLYKKGF